VAERSSNCGLRNCPVDYRRACYEAQKMHPKAGPDMTGRRWRFYSKKFPKCMDRVLSLSDSAPGEEGDRRS
jgi:hypothetical protein